MRIAHPVPQRRTLGYGLSTEPSRTPTQTSAWPLLRGIYRGFLADYATGGADRGPAMERARRGSKGHQTLR